MYHYQLHRQLRQTMASQCIDINRESDELFYARALANIADVHQLFMQLYGHQEKPGAFFQYLLTTIVRAHAARQQSLRQKDWEKAQSEAAWFTSNDLVGMSLYVDRFCGSLKALPDKLLYRKN